MFFLFLREQYKERRLSKTLAAVCYFHNQGNKVAESARVCGAGGPSAPMGGREGLGT